MNKKWFDKEYRIKRHAVRKLANSKRHDPMNADIRTTYHVTLNEYKQLLKKKQEQYRNEKPNELTNCNVDSQSFWNVFKTLPETSTNETPPPINESEWLQHFGKLHSSPKLDCSQQEGVRRELENMELTKTIANDLDFPTSTKKFCALQKY